MNINSTRKENVSHEELKGKVENYDLDSAISDLTGVIQESAGMYHQLKRIKFDYLVQTCELYSRMDYPTIMMESCRKEVTHSVPKAKSIEKLDF